MENDQEWSSEKIVDMVTEKLIEFEAAQVPANMTLAYFGNGFSRIAFGMGFSPKEFRSMIIEVADLFEKEFEVK